MPRSYIEIIYIDSDDLARKTNMEHVGATDAETWAEFKRLRVHAVDIKQAAFLLDYHNRKGDWANTIAISAASFSEITGTRPKSEREYRAIDRAYWDAAQLPAKAA